MQGNFDEKLMQNVVDEITRLNNQLQDLETYKDDFTPEEIEETQKDTLNQLMETKKILEKMRSGNLTTTTQLEAAQKRLYQVIAENFKVKDLINSMLANETGFLRESLKSVIRSHSLKKISDEEYNTSVATILQYLSKNTTLNEEEQKLYDALKKKNFKSLQEDKGIDKSKIEKNINSNK